MSVGLILSQLIGAYIFILIARAIISFIPLFGGQIDPSNPIVNAIYQVTEPPIAMIRQYIPNTGGFDLSFLVFFILLRILQNVVASLPF